MLTDLSAVQSTPARKSSHALACGTRAFIISHFARAALRVWFSRSTARTTSRSVKVSAAWGLAETVNAAATVRIAAAIFAQFHFAVSALSNSLIKFLSDFCFPECLKLRYLLFVMLST